MSVPSNIAEGHGRQTAREIRHFYRIARGSLFELETQLEICRRRKLLRDVTFAEFQEKIAKISAGLTKLIAKPIRTTGQLDN